MIRADIPWALANVIASTFCPSASLPNGARDTLAASADPPRPAATTIISHLRLSIRLSPAAPPSASPFDRLIDMIIREAKQGIARADASPPPPRLRLSRPGRRWRGGRPPRPGRPRRRPAALRTVAHQRLRRSLHPSRRRPLPGLFNQP